jgi:hypothetical protein
VRGMRRFLKDSPEGQSSKDNGSPTEQP